MRPQLRAPHRYHLWLIAIVSATIMLSSLAACGDHSEAVKTPGRTSRPWLVVLCQASDATIKPQPLAFYQKMFTGSSPSLDNVYNYFLDQSYGTIDIAGTTVLDWTPVATKTDDLRKLKRAALAQTCADTAKGKVNFGDFTRGGIIAMWNIITLDSGSGGGSVTEKVKDKDTKFQLVNGALDAQTLSFYTHEMLHGFGLNHARGPYPDNPEENLASLKADHSENHTFGVNKFDEYGDCWTIMGCGLWTFPDDPYGEAGPGLGAAQRDYLGWMPTDRILTYDRKSTMTVTLAAENTPLVTGKLLIKIPIDDSNYYTVEYIEKSGWNRNIAMDNAVLIHEMRKGSLIYSYIVSRNIYGAWLPGQVFLDSANNVRVSIDSYGTAATITLSPGGKGDGGKVTCDPFGYIFRTDTISSPYVTLDSPLRDAHATAGFPVTLSANVSDPTVAPAATPESEVSWTANGKAIGGGRTLTHTFATPGDYTIEVTVRNPYCLAVKKNVILHVDSPSTTLPTVTIVQPVDGQVFTVDPPALLQSVHFMADGSSDVDSYVWVDSVDGFLGSGQNLTTNLHLSVSGNCAHEDHEITLTGTTAAGITDTKTITVTLKSSFCIR